MRPDRIIVGEVRGAEAFDMMQAMNTGHEGSLTTVHSNSPRDALSRIENMMLMAGFDLPVRAIREQMSAAFHLVVQLARFADGARRVVTVSEVVGMEETTVTMQELFKFEVANIELDGQRLGGEDDTRLAARRSNPARQRISSDPAGVGCAHRPRNSSHQQRLTARRHPGAGFRGVWVHVAGRTRALSKRTKTGGS